MIQDCGGFELKNPYDHNPTATTTTSLSPTVAVSQTGVIVRLQKDYF